MGKIDHVRLSKTIAHALRHAPEHYGLALDDDGWTPVAALLAGLRDQRPAWRDLAVADLQALLARPGKRRFELRAGRIRALYGHSLERKIEKVAVEPPPTLYHGTAPHTAARIRRQGLRPMKRQYVHLSADRETAREVGRRRAPAPVVLTVDAAAAHAAGCRFFHGNGLIWLADPIPPDYIEVQTTGDKHDGDRLPPGSQE